MGLSSFGFGVKLSTRQNTVVRSVRLNRNFDELLEKDAKDKRLSYNALVMSILTKYVEWDRLVEKFGFVQIPHEQYKALMDAADPEQLQELAHRTARLAKENVLFWFKEVNLQNFLAMLSLIFKYSLGGCAEYDLKSDGRTFTFVVHHILGERYSNAFQTFMREAFRDSLGITPSFEMGKDHVVVKFQAP